MRTSLLCLLALGASLAHGQMVSGRDMTGFDQQLGLLPKATDLEVRQAGTSLVTNVLWPGEQGSFEFWVKNRTLKARTVKGTLRVVGYRTPIPEGDIWRPSVSRTGAGSSVPIQVSLPANGEGKVVVKPTIPARYGGYAMVLDFGKDGRLFGGTVARVVKPVPGRVVEPSYAIDMPWPHEMSEAVTRTFLKLGVKGCRMGASYTPTSSANFEADLARLGQHLDWCKRNNITVMLTIGAGSAPQPLGRGRPWLRTDSSLMEGNKEDLAWLPEFDPDFRKWTRIVCERYGWPKGPVNAVELWNEPWEGVSISGWGADLPRYREIYRQMALGVFDARKQHGSRVLIGGASSSTNTRDKLFPDGSDEFLQMLDFVSVHYEGNGGTAGLDPKWMGRKGPMGRVRVWDTESWVANSEDRIAGVVASMRSFGQDRAMGTYGGNVYSPMNDRFGKEERSVVQAWSPAAAVAAASKFIGDRRFDRLLFPNGLPWVYAFNGEKSPDDGTLVVLGDLTKLYAPACVLFSQAQLALPKKGGEMVLKAAPDFVMVDFLGNPVPPEGGVFRIPLNGNGYYLRTNGAKGAFARLRKAVSVAAIQGYPPAVIQAHDFLDRDRAALRVTLTNVLNRPVTGRLSASIGGFSQVGSPLRLGPNEVRQVEVKLPKTPVRSDNLYALTLGFDAGRDGKASLKESLRVNLIEARKVTVDGDLSEWSGALPQTLTGEGMRASLTEEAWLPFKTRTQSGNTLTTAYTAYDADGYYFAARIADPTPYTGTVRFETRDDDRYYYPEVATTNRRMAGGFAIRWTGSVVAPKSGDYRIITATDDGVRLWVDGKLVIDQWRDRGETPDEHLLNLKAGQTLDLRMEYFQGGGGASARLRWAGPGMSEAPIRATFKREVFSDQEMTQPIGNRTDSFIDFALGEDLPGIATKDSRLELKWPVGVRRFSYRMDPDLPAGNGTDNVQIGFNVLPNSKKPLMMNPRGVMPKYTVYPDTDYEFALNTVAPEFGGGTEIWRLNAPGIPRKHFYPRQPKAPIDGGPVKQGKLVVRQDGTSRIVEAFLPWSEIPHVKACLDANKPVRFSFRVNDNDGPAYELAQGRSVSKLNSYTFHNDWASHWANEIEFRFERKR